MSKKSDKKSSENAIAIIYGGVMKQSIIRVEKITNLSEIDYDAFVDSYGPETKGKLIKSENLENDYKKVEKLLEDAHQHGNLYSGVKLTDIIQQIKEICKAKQAVSMAFPKIVKSKPVAKAAASTSVQDSDADDDSDSESKLAEKVSAKKVGKAAAKPAAKSSKKVAPKKVEKSSSEESENEDSHESSSDESSSDDSSSDESDKKAVKKPAGKQKK